MLMRVLIFYLLLISSIAFGDIPKEGLVAYFSFNNESLENKAYDSLNYSVESAINKGAFFGPDRFGNEHSAAVFSGDSNSYIEIPDNDVFSINTTGALTISVWVCPHVLSFKNAESAGYVHWMGKGVPQQHEWVFRMYNKELTDSQENRPNRMSAYAFNLKGGLGSGSYVQEEIAAGVWMHIVARYDIQSNTITLFKNGIKKDQDPLYDETYGVQVENGSAPVRLGTRSLWSFFEGSIDDLRFYNLSLTENEILELYNEQNPLSKDSLMAMYPNKKVQKIDLKKSQVLLSNDYNIEFNVGQKKFDSIGRKK